MSFGSQRSLSEQTIASGAYQWIQSAAVKVRCGKAGHWAGMTTTIRQGAIADLDALIAFDDVAKSNEERRNQLENGLRDSEVSVAVVDGTPKGYALLNYRFFGHPFIELLYVASENRRSGIGSRLIEHVQEHAHGSKLFTSTNQSNEPMRAVLRQLGFEESGIIHNLDPGDPELVYFKSLSRS